MAEKIPMIALSPTMEIGTIIRWNVKEGDTVSSGDILCEVETDKATMEYESNNDGVLLKILISEGAKASVGMPIAIIGDNGEDIKDLLIESEIGGSDFEVKEVQKDSEKEIGVINESVETTSVLSEQLMGIKASPLAKKIALQQGIDIRTIQGSGPAGRIIKRDVEAVIKRSKTTETLPDEAEKVLPSIATDITKDIRTRHIIPGKDHIIPVSQKRSIIAERLSMSKFSAPHYYMRSSVNMDSILKARQSFNQNQPVKISINAIILKFVSEALKKHPMLNSSWQGESIIQYGRIDIGLAVAQKDGLITPVVRSVGDKSILAIDRELKVLIEKAKNNKLQPGEYKDATFTISNMGSYGIEEFTAVINPPGSAILAVGAIRKQPMVDENGQIVIQQIAKLNLSCDHRVIDGIVGASFMKELKDMMEGPLLLFFE